jgi:hypothetical protein
MSFHCQCIKALFGLMYRRSQPLAPKHKINFKNKLFLSSG